MAKTARVRCPRCAHLQELGATVTQARCPSCAARWRWAICPTCHTMNLPFEWDEVWRCTRCAALVRSWWRMPDFDAQRIERDVVRARTKEADPGLKPWLAGAAVLVAVAVVAVVLSIPRSSGPQKRRQASRPACLLFTQMRSAEAAGSLTEDQVRDEATGIARAAEPGTAAVIDAAHQLVTAAFNSGPGTDQFLAAETAMQDACDATKG